MHESATSILRGEHRLILRVAGALEIALDALESEQDPDVDLLADCVAFFRLFADACHHGKEESLLFAELESAGMPRDHGPIAVMLEEHRRGRALVRRMAGALDDSGVRDGPEFSNAARAWIDLIRAHIAKEDGVLFEMADHLVAGPACRRLCEAYGDADACRFEAHSKADLERLAERIEWRVLEAG